MLESENTAHISCVSLKGFIQSRYKMFKASIIFTLFFVICSHSVMAYANGDIGESQTETTQETTQDENDIKKEDFVIENGVLEEYTGTDNRIEIDLRELKTKFNITITKIDEGAFVGAIMKEIVIPNTVLEIGNGAFHKLKRLEKVTFEKGSQLEKIGVGAFMGTGIKNIEIPDNVRHIGRGAFEQCEHLSDVALNNKLEVIEARAFAVTSLSEIKIPDSVSYVGAEAFQAISASIGEKDIATKVTIGSGLEKISSAMFSNTLINKITIPNNITEIGERAFSGVFLKDGVKFEKNSKLEIIGREAFSGTTTKENGQEIIVKNSFRKIKIPYSVREIGEQAFQHTKLKELKLSNGLKIIGERAFMNSEIERVVIPSSVEKVLDGAFQSEVIEEVTVEGGSTYINSNVFGNAGKNLKEITFSSYSDEDILDKISFNGLDGTIINLRQNYEDTVVGKPWGGRNLTINWKKRKPEESTEETTEETTKKPGKPEKPEKPEQDREDATDDTNNQEDIPPVNPNDNQNSQDGGIIDSNNSNISVDKDGNIIDGEGNIIGTIDKDGNIRDLDGNIIGSVDKSGYIRDLNGNVIGYIDEYGNIILYDRDMVFGDLIHITREAESLAQKGIDRYIGEYLSITPFMLDSDLLNEMKKGGEILAKRKTLKPGFGFNGELTLNGVIMIFFLILLLIIIAIIIYVMKREMDKRKREKIFEKDGIDDDLI